MDALISHDRLNSTLAAILLLNLADTMLTILWVTSGTASEANPLMRELVELGPIPFAATKLAMVSFAIFLLWRWREHPWTRPASVGAMVLYFGVLILHVHVAAVSTLGPVYRVV
jgi:hypothetical protein